MYNKFTARYNMLEFSKIKIYMLLFMCKMFYYTLPQLENQNRIASIIKEIQPFSKNLSPNITITYSDLNKINFKTLSNKHVISFVLIKGVYQ